MQRLSLPFPWTINSRLFKWQKIVRRARLACLSMQASRQVATFILQSKTSILLRSRLIIARAIGDLWRTYAIWSSWWSKTQYVFFRFSATRYREGCFRPFPRKGNSAVRSQLMIPLPIVFELSLLRPSWKDKAYCKQAIASWEVFGLEWNEDGLADLAYLLVAQKSWFCFGYHSILRYILEFLPAL